LLIIGKKQPEGHYMYKFNDGPSDINKDLNGPEFDENSNGLNGPEPGEASDGFNGLGLGETSKCLNSPGLLGDKGLNDPGFFEDSIDDEQLQEYFHFLAKLHANQGDDFDIKLFMDHARIIYKYKEKFRQRMCDPNKSKNISYLEGNMLDRRQLTEKADLKSFVRDLVKAEAEGDHIAQKKKKKKYREKGKRNKT
jgi:hypothetical protein